MKRKNQEEEKDCSWRIGGNMGKVKQRVGTRNTIKSRIIRAKDEEKEANGGKKIEVEELMETQGR